MYITTPVCVCVIEYVYAGARECVFFCVWKDRSISLTSPRDPTGLYRRDNEASLCINSPHKRAYALLFAEKRRNGGGWCYFGFGTKNRVALSETQVVFFLRVCNSLIAFVYVYTLYYTRFIHSHTHVSRQRIQRDDVYREKCIISNKLVLSRTTSVRK